MPITIYIRWTIISFLLKLSLCMLQKIALFVCTYYAVLQLPKHNMSTSSGKNIAPTSKHIYMHIGGSPFERQPLDWQLSNVNSI